MQVFCVRQGDLLSKLLRGCDASIGRAPVDEVILKLAGLLAVVTVSRGITYDVAFPIDQYENKVVRRHDGHVLWSKTKLADADLGQRKQVSLDDGNMNFTTSQFLFCEMRPRTQNHLYAFRGFSSGPRVLEVSLQRFHCLPEEGRASGAAGYRSDGFRRF